MSASLPRLFFGAHLSEQLFSGGIYYGGYY